MQAMKQPVTLENFDLREAKMFLFSDELWLIISVAIRICFKHSYLTKTLTEVYEELNKETYKCNVCLQSNFKVYLSTQI